MQIRIRSECNAGSIAAVGRSNPSLQPACYSAADEGVRFHPALPSGAASARVQQQTRRREMSSPDAVGTMRGRERGGGWLYRTSSCITRGQLASVQIGSYADPSLEAGVWVPLRSPEHCPYAGYNFDSLCKEKN